jgi:para-aminobenzoate synthetase component 1
LQRQKAIFPLAEGGHKIIKQKMLSWSQQFSIFLFLDTNEYESRYGRFECLLGVDPIHTIGAVDADVLSELAGWHKGSRDWLLGHISYDYKNLLEPSLNSKHPVRIGFPLLQFFCPRIVCYIDRQRTSLTIESIGITPHEVFDAIEAAGETRRTLPELNFSHGISQEVYLETIELLRRHIAEGDCYEINYCSEGFCEEAVIQPLEAYLKLKALSPAPFAAFYRLNDKFLVCASPERYLYKDGDNIIAQPIKGTARRDADPQKDRIIREGLRNSIKERAENVMIVDLMRNDLARSCTTGSVRVNELFGIYSFPQVHQMISTVSGTLDTSATFADAIRYSFPMGSMTGAPKIKVMQLIEQYEGSRRELFSGTVGYITPEADFDFNVIIRSLFYSSAERYLSYQTGGAITYDSNAMMEWDEMRLKAWALERIFS